MAWCTTKYEGALISITDIGISPKYPCSNMDHTSASPATNNAIRGAEQSGNIAKQRVARKGEKVRG